MAKRLKRQKNAISHGLYASDIILPWEDETEFLKLLADFLAEYRPEGPTENELVIDLVRLRWLMRRIMRSAQLKFHADVMANKIGQAAKGSLDQLMDFVEAEAKQDDGIRKAMKDLSSIIANELSSVLEQVPRLQHKPGEEMSAEKEEEFRTAVDELKSKRLNLISKALIELVAPLAKVIQGLRNEKDVVEFAYAPDALEKIIKLEAMVGARFERTLGRLIAMQDYNRMHRGKRIEHMPKDHKRVE